MAPKITPDDTRDVTEAGPVITYKEGIYKVDGLEIHWRIPVQGSTDKHTDMVLVGSGPVDRKALAARAGGAEGDGAYGIFHPELDGRVLAPSAFQTTIIDQDNGRGYRLSIEVIDEVPCIVSFQMDTAPGFSPLRSADEFRKIPFRRLVNESVNAVAIVHGAPTGDFVQWRRGLLTQQDIERARRPRGGRAVHDLTRVAELYREAAEAGDATSKHIARELGVSPENARRLIARARQKGLLAPAEGTA